MGDLKPGARNIFLGLPRGCRVAILWAILYCLPRPLGGSWMAIGAARIRTSIHMGSPCVQGKELNHYANMLGQNGNHFEVYSQ